MTGTEPKMGDEDVTEQLRRLPELAARDPEFARRGAYLTTECLVGTFAAALHLSIVEGRIAAVAPGPALMRSWRFAYRAEPEAWRAFWEPLPRRGFHDLLALTKSGAAVLEGDLHPFMAHLQWFKDLLALPRGRTGERP